MEDNICNSSVQIMLSKFDEQPWGFRITGGADFGTPLTVIKVYGGTIAEQAGLQVDDILVGINEYPITNLSHQEAYQAFINAGNSFLLNIIRGSQVSSPPSNMAMEMAFIDNEYVSARPQELSTSENITTTEVFKQQTVEERAHNTDLTTQSEFGLDAIIAAVLSQGASSQDATESETFSEVYVNQDTEKQFEDLSYVLTEKDLNREEHIANRYLEEVAVVEVRDYRNESHTMDKKLAAEQQFEAEATETKTDYQYSKQQLEAEASETKTDYQYSEVQLEAEALETKTDYQYTEQFPEAETTETKIDYQYSESQLEAETTEAKTDYQNSEPQLEAETTEIKTDYQYIEQQLEAETTVIKTDYQDSKQQLEAEPIEPQVTAEELPLENVMADTGVKKQHCDMQLLKDNIEKNRPFLPLMAHPRPVLQAGGIKLTLPKDIYDDEFIAETLSGNAEIITGTTLGVNFYKYRRNYDYLKSSSVYQLIHEEESKSSSSFQG